MTKEKAPNYTAEIVADIIAVYQAADDSDDARKAAMEESAAKHGRSVASIRSKLAFESVYIPLAKATPKGGSRVKKSDMVSDIAANAGLANDSFFDSLEGANKAVLTYVAGLQVANFELESELFDTDEAIVAAAEALEISKALEAENADAS
jgi:hypothetical protein